MSISFLFLQLSNFCQMLPFIQKTANQTTSFYMKYNIELEWVNAGFISQIFDQEFENRKNLRLDFHLLYWFDPIIKLQIWYECSKGVSLKNQNFSSTWLLSFFNNFENSCYGANFSPISFSYQTKTILQYSIAKYMQLLPNICNIWIQRKCNVLCTNCGIELSLVS